MKPAKHSASPKTRQSSFGAGACLVRAIPLKVAVDSDELVIRVDLKNYCVGRRRLLKELCKQLKKIWKFSPRNPAIEEAAFLYLSGTAKTIPEAAQRAGCPQSSARYSINLWNTFTRRANRESKAGEDVKVAEGPTLRKI